jgi:hypothetical protein
MAEGQWVPRGPCVHQIGNLTPIEYEVNLEVSDRAPSEYGPELSIATRHGAGDTARLHALPDRWWP